MSHASLLNAGAYLSPRNGGQLSTITAAAGQDGVEQNGPAIDRLGFDSACIAILSRANLTASQTLALSLTLQDSADGTTFTDVAAEHQPGGVAGGGLLATKTATGDAQAIDDYNVNLRGCRQYIRCQYTANLSAGATDTASVAVVVILGGAQSLPQ